MRLRSSRLSGRSRSRFARTLAGAIIGGAVYGSAFARHQATTSVAPAVGAAGGGAIGLVAVAILELVASEMNRCKLDPVGRSASITVDVAR